MTENSMRRLLNTTYDPVPSAGHPPAASAPPVGPSGSAGPGAGASAMDPAVLRRAAKTIPEVETQVRRGSRTFPGETGRAAGALGEGWTTAAAMRRISAEWSEALRRLADEADFLGDAVTKSAANRQWAEAVIQERIARIRAGGH